MTKTTMIARTWILAAAVALDSVALPALDAPTRQGAPAHETEADYSLRIELALPSAARSGDVAGSSVVRTLRLTRPAMLYRFKVTRIDGGESSAHHDHRWAATIRIAPAGGDRSPVAPRLHLSSDRREFTLPAPLGLLVDAGDEIVFEVAQASGAHDDERLQLSVDGEPVVGSSTRLAVIPTTVSPSEEMSSKEPTAGRGESSWEWSPAVDGRILAIAGNALAGARHLVLEDAASGERLWERSAPASSAYGARGAPGDVIRLGIAVHAGRAYRLRVTWRDQATDGATDGADAAERTIVAMMLPVRHTAP